jgi:hypothetical protein
MQYSLCNDSVADDRKDNFNTNEEEEKATKNSRKQLLKWVGNKQRFAQEIVSYFPTDYGTYFEPFLVLQP